MSFATIPDRTEYKKAAYVYIKTGKPVLFQLLDEKAERFLVHTIRTSDNRYIKVEHDPSVETLTDKDFNAQYKPRTIFRTNVLNVTPVVTNPANGNVFQPINGVIPEIDPSDGSSLRGIEPQPLNEVQILERGIMLFSQINTQIDTMSHTKDDFDHREVVFQIQATGSGRQMQTVVFFRPDIPAVTGDVLSGYELLDLTLPSFTEAEIKMMLNGVAVKEIWESRRNKDDTGFGASAASVAAPAAGLDYSSGGLPGIG